MDKEIIDGIAYIKSSKNRYKVVESLKNEIKIPSEIANETGIRLNHVSTLLKDLKNENIVECLNEDFKRGRLYNLTDKGNKAIEFINNQN